MDSSWAGFGLENKTKPSKYIKNNFVDSSFVFLAKISDLN